MYAGINVMAGGGGLLSREELICKIGGLAVLCSSIVYEGITLAHYFSSQLPTPPSAKKLFWKTTSEIMRNKFKPKPQLEPATGPAQQYTTIDTLIS